MKYRTLQATAFYFKILAWIVAGIGVISTLLLSIRAERPFAALAFLLIGFTITAVNILVMLAISQLIHLALDVQKNMSEIAEQTKMANNKANVGH